MPVELVKSSGLPFPFFIKTDDIEYGIRALKEIVTLNGVGVWHDSFDGKFSYYLEYYIKRNELVCNSVHEKHSAFLALKKLYCGIGKCLVRYNYRCVSYIIMAYDDFFKGPDFFLGLDEKELNSKLRQTSEKLCSGAELGIDRAEPMTRNKKKSPLQIITLNGYLLPGFLLYRREKNIKWAAGSAGDYFRFKNIIEYDPVNDRGIKRRMNRRWLIKASGLLIKYTVLILFRYRHTAKRFRDRMEEITSPEFWCGHLEINNI